MIAWSTALSFSVLGVATLDDIMTRKIHNLLLAIASVLSFAVIWWFGGLAGIENAASGAAVGIAMYLPLAYLGIVGGGDMKLLGVAGLSLGLWQTVLVGGYALIWGAILGLLQVVLKGQLKELFSNILRVAKREKITKAELHKIPYSAALLLAALTQWTLHHHRGELL